MTDSEFQFDPASLATPRKPGISAYMRIKNEQQFLRLCIESHLPFYDEIVCAYNDCTDNTEAILQDLQQQHPDKIKVLHYLPKVHPVATPEHDATPTESVHSLANYCNYALSKCTYSVAAKLDADHLAIAQNLAPLMQIIRADIQADKRKIYWHSGINLIQNRGQIMCGGDAKIPFGGNYDHFYHPVCPQIRFIQRPVLEKLFFPTAHEMEAEYMGIMYFHLNRLKSERLATHSYRDGAGLHAVPFAEFATEKNFTRMKKLLKAKDRLRYAVYSCPRMRRLKYRLIRQHVHFRPMRLLRLQQDLQGIDFKRDVLEHLQNLGDNA